MQSGSFRYLQNIAPSTLHKRLTSESVLVITMNNKPFAAMINLNDENVQELLLLVSRLRTYMATLSIDQKDACRTKNEVSSSTKHRWKLVLILT